MTTEKVALTGEKETLLITLYAKAGESRLPDSLLHDHFAAEAVSSGEVAFDGFSRLGVRLMKHHRSVKATGASMHWSIDDPGEIERQFPKLRLLTDLTAYDPRGYDAAEIARMSRMARLTVRLIAAVPPLRRMRWLRYRFPRALHER